MSENFVLDALISSKQLEVLSVATRLRLFTFLSKKEMDLSALAKKTGSKIKPLKILLDCCLAMGLLRFDTERYKNTQIADAYLVEDRPLYMGNILLYVTSKDKYGHKLYNLVKYGRVAALKENKSPSFTMGMHNIAMYLEAEALASAVSLKGCKQMVDVGCGSGFYSISICRHYPQIYSTLIDKKHVLNTARKIVRQNNLQNRISLHPGDILKCSYGKNVDVVLISDVLYGKMSSCARILQSAFNAMAPGGKLVIRGYFNDPTGKQSLFGAIFFLAALLSDPSSEAISIPMLVSWVKKIGFKIEQIFSPTERSSCIIAKK